MNQPINGITGGTMEYFSADEIPALFKRSGLSIGELAVYVDVHPNTISRWLKGKKKSSLKQEHRAKFVQLRRKVEESES
jgi:DNA-binding transcriptional regulator YiaG